MERGDERILYRFDNGPEGRGEGLVGRDLRDPQIVLASGQSVPECVQ